MPLEVVMRDEIAASIVAVAVAMLSASAAHGAANVEYCRGVLDTLRAQAISHRIPWIDVQRELRAVLDHGGRDDLLDVIGLALPSG
jgi:hypothetical protein